MQREDGAERHTRSPASCVCCSPWIREKWDGPSPLPQQLLPPWCPMPRAGEKGNGIRAVLPSTLPKSALLEPFWALWEVLIVSPTVADIYFHCLNNVSFLHVPTWPADREEMLSQQSYSLQQDALLEIFWSRDIIWNCASILKQLTVRVQSSYLEYRRQKISVIFIHYLYYEYISLCTFLCPQAALELYAISVPWMAYWARFLTKHHFLKKVNDEPSKRSVYLCPKNWFKVLFTRTSRNRNLRRQAAETPNINNWPVNQSSHSNSACGIFIFH